MKKASQKRPTQRKSLKNNYLPLVIIVGLLLTSNCVHSQFYDSTKVLQYVNAYGYAWKNGKFRGPLILGNDTSKLAKKDSGAIAFKMGKFWGNNGYGWEEFGSGDGTVTSVSVVNTNGFNGSVANPSTTPAITISTTVNGMVKGNGTAISAATADVDYATPAYADAKVEDAIVNGVTTKAPSQNAVYDALALKLNISDTAAMLDPYLKEADLPIYTASNGLTKSVNDFQLGGALTKNTNISAANYELNINDTSEFGTHRFTMQTNGNAMIIGKVSNTDSTMLRMSTEDVETMMISYYNGNVYRSFTNAGESTMEALNSDLKGVSLHLQTTGATFIDTKDVKRGLEYDGDYSSGYTDRSLVDKGFITNTLASYPKNLITNTTDVGNIGAGEDNLMTYTIPAGKLATNGDYLEFTISLSFAANANNKQVKVYFGSTAIYASGSQAQNDGSMEIKGTIVRTGATSQRITFSQANNTLLFPDYSSYVTASETMANTIVLKATGEATSDNDIVQKILTVKYFPAN